MRSSKKRSRSNQNRPRSLGNIVNRVFDSSGPEGKVRGTPQQIIEKYQALARDAQLSNDRVAAENFLQHAEHYTRMLAEAQREMAAEQEARQQHFQQNGGQNGGRERGERGDYRQDNRGENREGREAREPRERHEGRADYRESRHDNREPSHEPQPEAGDLSFTDSTAAGLGAEVIDFGNDDANLVELPEARRRQDHRRDNRHENRNENRREPRQDFRADAVEAPEVEPQPVVASEPVEAPITTEAAAPEAAPAARAPRAPRAAKDPAAPREPRQPRAPRVAAPAAEGEADKRRERRPRKPRDAEQGSDTPEAAQ